MRRSLLPVGIAGLTMALLLSCATTETAEDPAAAPADPSAVMRQRVDELREQARANPRDAEVYYRLGNALFDLQEYSAAKSAYEEAILRNPNYAAAYSNLGLSLRRLGELDKTIEAYNVALSLAPDDVITLRNLIVALLERGDTDRAFHELKRLRELQPEDVQVLANLARTAFDLGEYGEAADAFEALLRLDPGLKSDYYNLGLCFYYMEDFDRALTTWLTALAYAPKDASVNKALATLYWRRGEYDQAWAAVTKCQALGAHLDPEFIENLQRDSGRDGP